MAKLHEMLAVEGQLKAQAQATRTDLRNTFEKKRHLFEKKVVTFQPTEEGLQATTEQQSDLQSNIRKELTWIAGIWGKALDVAYVVADGNTKGRADVVLDDGTVLLKSAPATALLELEKRAAEIQELVTAIPTLDPAKGFAPDTDQGSDIYRAREVIKTRSKKDVRVITLAVATPEHPAQAQIVPVDVLTGHTVEQEWSSLITPAQKADLLERAEELRRAVKRARMRANDVEIADQHVGVGKAIFDYVFDNKKGAAVTP